MRARVLGGLGALATLLAAGVVLAPGLTDPVSAALSVVRSQDPQRLLLVLGLVVGSYAAWTARARSPERAPTEGPAARFAGGDRPESASAADRTRTGGTFDERVAAACDGDERALRAVRSNLASAATSAHARAADRPPERAESAVETGAWTDDRTAAAFLAGESGPDFSLVARLRSWLDPAAERRRRVERTVEAVGRALDEETGATGSSERVADDALADSERASAGGEA
ncbi:hypothetical protein M0R88_14475 [Halorussus gelatinilyticus]|uniref:Uncharacterized protein n=1 Tax=Halorussus gelatinilyticus TaxID=2937524 RepID=A0A8U0IFG0_9EURY|nr:hypothetical protein [Halorussus gelatinilyticus]UPV99712.1 hypothetical protein M0R88_14475 [Halorussus gelatinilyticus]